MNLTDKLFRRAITATTLGALALAPLAVSAASPAHAAEPGSWMPEQVIDPEPYLSRLAQQGLCVMLPPAPAPRRKS